MGDGTKYKTCFGCPRMILCGPGICFVENFCLVRDAPPGLAKDQTFYKQNLAPFPYRTVKQKVQT